MKNEKKRKEKESGKAVYISQLTVTTKSDCAGILFVVGVKKSVAIQDHFFTLID